MAVICVYCGSSRGKDSAYLEAAKAVGKALALGGHTLVYGGGNLGLMGAVANEALAHSGKVVGVITEKLLAKEVGHPGLSDLHVVDSMHERKLLMANLSDAFIALPGGIGTLEEIIEVFVWTQLGIHLKACGLLNVAGFYDPLLACLEQMTRQAFVSEDHLAQLIVRDDAEDLLAGVLALSPLDFDKCFHAKSQER